MKNGFDLFFTFSSEKLTPDTTWDTAQFTIGKPALVIRDPASGKPGKTFAAVAEPFEKTFVFQNPERVAAEDRSKPAAASGSDLMKEFQASADNAQIQFSDIKIENDVLTYTLTSETDQDEFRFENTGLRSFSDSSVIGVKTYALVIQVDFILPDGRCCRFHTICSKTADLRGNAAIWGRRNSDTAGFAETNPKIRYN